jgi:hypothetical protein
MADSPKEAEVAQVMFCYLADSLGLAEVNKEWPNYINAKTLDEDTINKFFLKKYGSKTYETIITSALGSNIDTSGVDLKVIKKFFTSQGPTGYDWFKSSLKIGQSLLTQLNTVSTKLSSKISPPGWKDIFYVRGDKQVVDAIAECFRSANKQSSKNIKGNESFGNINKWSPADIYFASKECKKVLSDLSSNSETKKDNLTFAKLNETIGKLIKEGDILPLSLKKAVGSIKIVKVNFIRKIEEKLISETYCKGIQPWNKQEGSFKIVNKKFILQYPLKVEREGSRDMYILIESNKQQGRIQVRHAPASGGKPQSSVKVILSYKGASAFGGQLVGIPLLTKLISGVDTNFSSKLRTSFDSLYKKFEKTANDYINLGEGKKLYNSGKKEDKNKFNEDIGVISALTVMNDLRPIITEYFKKTGEQQHNVVRAIFAYVSSRSPLSSPFVIAKD